MSKRIAKAIAAYQASVTPSAVKLAQHAVKGRDYALLITADAIRMGAASALHDVLAEEIAR
jgi:signal recognition particle GTPase